MWAQSGAVAADPILVEAHTALEYRPSSPADDLLEARFAFADPRGLVTRWGAGAGTLFGIAADQIVGESLFEVALAGEDAGWRRFLGGDETRCPSSLVELSVTRPDGPVFPCEVHIVPVLLADAFDFTQFAADLTSGHTGSHDAFRQRHARVLGLIDAAAHEGAHYAEDQRLAGLIATFRSSGDAPVTSGERIDEALDRAERAEREVEELRDPLAQVATEFADVRSELIALLERIETLEAHSGDVPDAKALAAAIERTLATRMERAVAERVDEVLPRQVERAMEDRIGSAVAETVEAAVARSVEAARALGEEALVEAREARAEAEQVGRELHTKRAAAPKPPPVGFYSTDAQPAAPDRAPLPDFDDVATPLAMLTLEGRFTHLNGAFRELVGYTEEEFRSARWPSPADSEHMESDRELRRALATGAVDEAPVETAFMHREGLLIPLVGRMSLVRDAGGAPGHLLFRVGRA